MAVNSEKKRPPIEEDSRHAPGQSLAQQFDTFVNDKIFVWFMMGIVVLYLVIIEWAKWLFDLKPHPVAVTVVAIGYGIFAFFKVRTAIRQAESLKMGIRGEKAVGLFLQDVFVPKGYSVFHDICEEGCNIDHVIIGPNGVYAVETKTISKTPGNPRVEYDGKIVKVNGRVPDRDPVVQAKACAASLREILRRYTGKGVDVRPVVLYPGWFVCPQPKRVETWVLNHKALGKFVANEPRRFIEDEVRLLSEGLRRYVADFDSRKTY